MNSKDVVALVTGGGSGLGEATVSELVKNGAKVAIVDVDSVRGEKLAAGLGANSIFVKADVTSEAEIQQAVKKTIDAFGKINVAVSCAESFIITLANIVTDKRRLPDLLASLKYTVEDTLLVLHPFAISPKELVHTKLGFSMDRTALNFGTHL